MITIHELKDRHGSWAMLVNGSIAVTIDLITPEITVANEGDLIDYWNTNEINELREWMRHLIHLIPKRHIDGGDRYNAAVDQAIVDVMSVITLIVEESHETVRS